MILSLSYKSMESEQPFDEHIEDCLIALSKAAGIIEARVTIQHLPGEVVSYRTEIFVSVPGAEYQIQACDQLAKMSFNRAAIMLEKRLRSRAMQRARQVIDARIR